jgi:hypothetical protein
MIAHSVNRAILMNPAALLTILTTKGERFDESKRVPSTAALHLHIVQCVLS